MAAARRSAPDPAPDPALAPGWLRPALWPLALLYRGAVVAWAAAYRRGLLRSRRAPAPVISVGNLTVGGSGKTPFAEYLLREAARLGLRPVGLSRGYGRVGRSAVARVRVADGILPDPAALGDEPSLLAQRNPELALYVGANRHASARLAAALDAPGLFVLDDGFQHLALQRDLNVLLVDAQRGLGNEWVFPLGPLREPVSALARADVIVISKANLGDADALQRRLAALAGSRTPIFRSDYRPVRVTRLDGQASVAPAALAGAEVTLLSGIAQPSGFARAVEQLGAGVRERIVRPDHHPYAAPDVAALAARLRDAPADRPGWITTEKDAVKLRGRLPASDRLWVLEMEVVPESAAQAFFFDSLRKLAIK